MLLSLFATIQIGVNQVSAASDQDGDGPNIQYLGVFDEYCSE